MPLDGAKEKLIKFFFVFFKFYIVKMCTKNSSKIFTENFGIVNSLDCAC